MLVIFMILSLIIGPNVILRDYIVEDPFTSRNPVSGMQTGQTHCSCSNNDMLSLMTMKKIQ